MAYHWQNNENGYKECIDQIFLAQDREKFRNLERSNLGYFAGSFQSNEQNLLHSNNYIKLQHPGVSENNSSYKHANSNCKLSFPFMRPQSRLQNDPHLCHSSYQPQYLKTNSNSLICPKNKECHSDLSKELSQEDASFLVTWFENIEKLATNNKNEKCSYNHPSSKNLKISNVQNAFFESNQRIIELEMVFSKLTSIRTTDAEWKTFVQKAEGLKLELEEIKSFISDSINNGKLGEIIEGRRNKRRRVKIKKKQWKEKYLHQKKHWKEKEKKIDLWLKRMHDNQKAILQAQEVQKAADSILHEVRTKQEEAQKIKDLVIALNELREIRLKKGEIHGFISKSDDCQIFKNMSAELMVLINSQLNQYGLEEQTLCVMMENSPNVLPDKTHLPNKSTKSKEEFKREIYEVIFGKNIPYNKLDAQQRFLLAAEDSVEMLIRRRSSWDKYLANDDSPASISASVPLGWIIPQSNPSLEWKKYQIN